MSHQLRLRTVAFFGAVLFAGLAIPAALHAETEALIPSWATRIDPRLDVHARAKRNTQGRSIEEHTSFIQNRFRTAAKSVYHEEVAIYLDSPLSDAEITEFKDNGIRINPNIWVPPVPGRHPLGFHLAEMDYTAVPYARSQSRIRMLWSTEDMAQPQNDLAIIRMNVDDVHAGAGVPANDGTGIIIAVADSGIDLTHADFPAPVDAWDMTDGTSTADWGPSVANTVSSHGTHVTGSVLGRAVLSAAHPSGGFLGSAPGASLAFYKIGDDFTASATSTDMIEAMVRAEVIGASIFSMSYGGIHFFNDGTEPACQAIDANTALGVTSFISAGNNGAFNRHKTVTVPDNGTSATFTLRVVNGTGAVLNVPYGFVAGWLDNIPGDLDLSITCTNLGGGETFTELFSGTSLRGTEAKEYELLVNLGIGVTKDFTFEVSDVVGNGSATDMQVTSYVTYTNAANTFLAPDSSYTVSHPAFADTAIAVGAWNTRSAWTNWQGSGFTNGVTVETLASFSSRGPRIDGTLKPDILAPGQAIISCSDSVVLPANTRRIDNDGISDGLGPADYFANQGTSMACPHAAGVAALLLAHNGALTPAQIRAALTTTADNAGSPNNNLGHGVINALAAIQGLNPTVTVNQAVAQADPTNALPIVFRAEFSEPVTGFAATDPLVTWAGSGVPVVNVVPIGPPPQAEYDIEITGLAGDDVLSVTIPAAAAQSLTAVDNVASTSTDNGVRYDAVPPAVTSVFTTSPAFTNSTNIDVTVVFNEPMLGFLDGMLSTTNSTAMRTSGADGDSAYEFVLTPLLDGLVTAGVSNPPATDEAGNVASGSGSISVTYDGTAPTATVDLLGVTLTNVSPIPVEIAFSEDVLGFGVGGINVVNGTAGNFAVVDPQNYTADITPTGADVLVSVTVAAGSAADAAGNTNIASTTENFQFDSVGPIGTFTLLATDPTNLATVPSTLLFDEDIVTVFDPLTHLTTTNVTISNFLEVTPNREYTFDLSPIMEGLFEVTLVDMVVSDAAGNLSSTTTDSRTYDITGPTLLVLDLAIGQLDPDDTLPVFFFAEFDEDVVGFDPGDIDFSGSTAPGALGATITPLVGMREFEISINGATGTGIIRIGIDPATLTDDAGNAVTTGLNTQVLYAPPLGVDGLLVR